MSSQHESMMSTAGTPALNWQHGESITYLPKSGGSSTVTAIVRGERTESRTSSIGVTEVVVRDVTISNVPGGTHGGVANPARGDRFVVGDEEYLVDMIREKTGRFFLTGLRTETGERHATNYRRGFGGNRR